MFFHILKRDLQRKKTMNFIILLFVILAVTFIASSASNLAAVVGSLDDYFDQADVGDYTVLERGENGKSAAEIARGLDCVTKVRVETILYNTDGIKFNGETISSSGINLLSSIDNRIENYYDGDNNELTEIPQGGAYIRKSYLDSLGMAIGDKFSIKIGSTQQEFTVKGYLKDAAVGGSMINAPRFVINHGDFDIFMADEAIDAYKGTVTFLYTDDVLAVEQAMNDCQNLLFAASKSLLQLAYMMEMIVVGLLMILSLCLILIAIVILRFTITFTLSEEFREIGIMKAIGIPNGSIRSLYLVKYLAISLIGAAVGLVLSAPFGKLLLRQTSENLMISAGNPLVLEVLCAMGVVAVIMLFCWRSTRMVKTYTPVDAIRSGSTGERYKKKGFLKLSQSPMKPVPFMSVNDILSGFGKYTIMLITFTIGMVLISIVLNSISTLRSPKLLSWFGMAECDVLLTDNEKFSGYFTENGREKLEADIKDIQKQMEKQGYDVEVFGEIGYKFTVTKGELSAKSTTFEGIHTTTDMYHFYIEGTPPQNTREIAITHVIADKIGASVGDTVTVTSPEGDKDYIISALFQTMTSTGEGILFHEDERYDFTYIYGVYPFQIRFNDNPSPSERSERMETIKKLYPDCTVQTAGEYADEGTGGAGGYLNDTKWLIVLVVILINILVAVLMEKSFLTKERGEIAMLKAIGFKNSSIIGWQVLRITIVMLLSALISGVISTPMSELTSGAIFRAMGAKTIIFDVNIPEAYLLYPAVIIAVTVFFVFLTALSVHKVNSNEINSVE